MTGEGGWFGCGMEGEKMNDFSIVIIIGFVAGLIEAIPMIVFSLILGAGIEIAGAKVIG